MFSGTRRRGYLVKKPDPDPLLNELVDNYKMALKAKGRALRYGKYKDIKEFRERIEQNKTFISEPRSDVPELGVN